MRFLLIVCITFSACILSEKEKVLFDSSSSVGLINSKNFKQQIVNLRIRDISILLFYKRTNPESKKLVEPYNTFAANYRLIFRVFAIECISELKLCNSEEAEKFPSLKVYPPFPAPAYFYNISNGIDENELRKELGKYMKDVNVEVVNQQKLSGFFLQHPERQKVLYFLEEGAEIPFSIKALSNNFYDTLIFGAIYMNESSIVSKYKISKSPSIIVLRKENDKPIIYKGDKHGFHAYFDFINPYAEKFIFGDPRKNEQNVEEKVDKSFLFEKVPKLTSNSYKHLINPSLTITILYLTKEKDLSNKEKEMLYRIHFKFVESSSGIHGSKMGYYKPDSDLLQELHISESALPTILIIKYGTKNKKYVNEEPLKKESDIESLLNKLPTGEIRFTPMKNLIKVPESNNAEL